MKAGHDVTIIIFTVLVQLKPQENKKVYTCTCNMVICQKCLYFTNLTKAFDHIKSSS